MGHIGRRHAALIDAHPEATLVAVCDVLPASQLSWPEGLAERVSYYPDLSAALKEKEAYDVACICTPNGLHATQAIDALRAGLHVVLEKPIALTAVDAQKIAAVAQVESREVFGVMQNRYSPASAWLKKALDDNALGDVLQVHLDCFWNRDERYYFDQSGELHPWHGDADLDGGVLFTQFSHFIDLLCWAFGAPQILAAQFRNQRHQAIHPFPDTGMVHFSLPGGSLGSLNFSTGIWDKNFESTLTVIGSKGTIKLGGQYMNLVRHCHVAGLAHPELPPSLPANDYGGYTGSAANHHYVIDNVVDVLRGRANVATPVEDGIAVVKTIEAMQHWPNSK